MYPSVSRAIRRVLSFGKKDERSYFDALYYRNTYTDIARAGADPYEHFMTHGWREGRNPSPRFNTLYYRDKYLDGAEVNPLQHYLETGRFAGNSAIPISEGIFLAIQRQVVADLFEANYYSTQSGPVAEDPLTHYLSKGWRKSIAPSPTFDPTQYLAEHSFVRALDVSPLYHFASQKRMREPRPSRASKTVAPPVPRNRVLSVVGPEFDASYYLSANPDVAKASLDALSHFIDFGWREGRNPSPLFKTSYYLSANTDVADQGINPFYHYLTEGRAEGRHGNPTGTSLYPPLVAPSTEDWAAVPPAAATDGAEYIVIMPVYKGFDETLASIHAVLASKQTTRYALHVINDLTPDATLDAALADLAAKGLFSYAKNETNLGFVKSVNAGLRLFPRKEVILLNADAVVFGDWLDRIDKHAKRDTRIATITPISNNATICGYPVSNDNNLVQPEVPAEELDRMAAACNAGRVSDLPTGVGFCFFMSRASREALGLLDEEAFGRGYGEENDFCLRATKAGFRNVMAEDVFVYHAGQISFAELAATEYGPGQAALLGKHPDYPLRIQQHLKADAGEVGRMRLDLFRLARDAQPNAMIFVAHALTGGVATHTKQMEARLRDEGMNVVHIRVGVGDRWSVEVSSSSRTAPYCPNLRPTPFNQIRPLLIEFFGWLAPKAIHIHSLVGFDWVATAGLLVLIRDSAIPYYFTLHDYSVVCHRNDLVQPNGRYCGLPEVAVCQACVNTDRSYPEALDPRQRRQTFDDFLVGATDVFAPSADLQTRLTSAGARYKISVRPHEDMYPLGLPAKWAPLDTGAIDVVTIGAIGAHKGSRVLLNLARDATARGVPIRFHIIGYSDLTEELIAAGATESGRYRDDGEVFEHLNEIRPSCIFLPSIWPETFCYTLSLAFKAAIPPVVFDLGAQRERVLEAGFGFVLPYAFVDDVQGLNDALVSLRYETAVLDRSKVQSRYDDILVTYYGMDAAASPRKQR